MKLLIILALLCLALVGCTNKTVYIPLQKQCNSSSSTGNYTDAMAITAVNTSSFYQIYVNWSNVLNTPSISGSNASDTGWVLDDNSSLIKTNRSYVSLGFNYPTSALYVDGNWTTHIYALDSPWALFGGYRNYLLQTEDFSSTTWVKNNISWTVTANLEYDPRMAMTAEWIRSNKTNANISQTIVNTELNNWTFSIYARNVNLTGQAYLCMQINLNESYASGTKNLGDISCFNLTTVFERYKITRNIVSSHANKSIMIIIGNQNISLWGAQLEQGLFPARYSGTQTTSATSTWTNTARVESALTIAGAMTSTSCSCVGAISGTTCTGSTSTGTGADTRNIATIQRNISTIGLNLVASTATTSAVPWQFSPTFVYTARLWNGTHDTTFNYTIGLRTDNTTKGFNITDFVTLNNASKTNLTISDIVVNNSNATILQVTKVIYTRINVPNMKRVDNVTACIEADIVRWGAGGLYCG
jgi:hypothetical protein